MNDKFGLFSNKSEPVPLMGVAVKGDILGRGAKIKVSQRFRNQEKKSIEAVYKFPLPEGAAICAFKATIDGRVIKGQVEERDKAFEIYDKALSEGHGGYLLDEDRPNIFTLSVGNLQPDTEAVIDIDYVTLLDMEGAKTRFYLPTTISPRYTPENMPDRDGIPEGERITPTYAQEVPYGLSMALDIHEGRLIETVESPTHPISVEIGKEPIHVSFSAESVKMDRDFILYLGYQEALVSRAYRHQFGENLFYQLDLSLKDQEEKQSTDSAKEIVFVLDCSGSMDGDSIHEAKKALEVCLKGMDTNTSFNIYRFGSTFQSLFNQSQRYSEDTLPKALDYLQRAQADLGGTEILAPLKHMYGNHPTSQGKRNIILLTDGEVGNEKEVFNLVRENRDHTRFFPVGIGAGPNEFFIKGIARAGGGMCEFIHPGERIEPKVLRIFQKLGRGSLENVGIKWGNGLWEQAPQNPAFFSGSPLTLFAKGNRDRNLPEKFLEITGTINGQNREWRIDIVRQDQDGNSPIPVLWARERIRDLEEMGGDMGRGGSRQVDRKSEKTRDMILELSKKYGILSSLTSFVAIEEREEKDKHGGEIILRKVPSLVTVGWHGISRIAAGPPMVMSASATMAKFRIMPALKAAEPLYRMRISKDTTKMDVLMEILSLQRATGGLELTAEVSQLLRIDFQEIGDLASAMEISMGESKFLVLSTALLLLVLELHFLEEETTWRGVVQKSHDWLEEIIKKGKPRIQGRDLKDWGEEYLKKNIRISGVLT